jgi:hypothetical protein
MNQVSAHRHVYFFCHALLFLPVSTCLVVARLCHNHVKQSNTLAAVALTFASLSVFQPLFLRARHDHPLDSTVTVMLKLMTLDALILMMVWFLLLPSPAQAYFDLGTGTYLVQLMLAFGATAWFSLRRVFVGKPKFSKTPEVENVEKTAPADDVEPSS